MQNATTVLSVIQKLGTERKPLERVYRILFNPELYRLAYARLHTNAGALTPGSDSVTLDGMSEKRIARIIEALRCERWRWTPVRRTYIPKRGKQGTRPLGIPSGDDKLLQEVMRLILEAYYEPRFSSYSHGFRPSRGCHTALQEVGVVHSGAKWFIEGDISKCFDNFDHEVMLRILREDIHDERFLNLIHRLLAAGYMEDWRWHRTMSGTPQGGVISPLLSNIYLDKLDQFVEQELLPAYNRGTRGKTNPEYDKLKRLKATAKRNGDRAAYRRCQIEARQLPSQIESDRYRRLRYIRYADDFLLSFSGPRAEAEEIKNKLAEFLVSELRLHLSQEKTLITHARSEPARFLGYEVRTTWADTKLFGKRKCRCANGSICLRVPKDRIREFCRRYMRNGKPIHRAELVDRSDYDIISVYQAEFRGYVQFYALAMNVCDLDRLHWVMEVSLMRTLANKYRTSVNEIARKYKTTIKTGAGPRKCLRVEIAREGRKPLVAIFGGIPLKRQRRVSTIADKWVTAGMSHSELLRRMLADTCEMCGEQDEVEVHHIRRLANLDSPGRRPKPMWMQRMSAIRRKTLVVCEDCHRAIHTGRHKPEWDLWKDKLESRVK